MKVIAFDIETGDADAKYTAGPEFVRLCGWGDATPGAPVTVSTDPRELVAALKQADAITGHNIINYDLLCLAIHGFVTFDEYEALCLKSFDTLVVARHLEPVAAKGAQPNHYYRLASVTARYGVDGKDTVDFDGKVEIVRRIRGDKVADASLKARETRIRKAVEKAALKGEPDPTGDILAETFGVLDILKSAYGGYDKIPQDDSDYVRYLVKDVRASAGLFGVMFARMQGESKRSQAYARSEHSTELSMGRVTLEGARVHMDLTLKRWSEGQARLEAGKQMLHEEFGMPTEGKKPHASNKGKAAFRAAIRSTLKVSDDKLDGRWPLAKDGSLLTGKEVLSEFAETFDRNGYTKAALLCRTVMAMNGERTIYGTVLDHVVGGRVHPYIGPDQSSGRWSMKNPGLTVFGKRGGKARERAIILADTDDEVLVAIDADQVDARVIAAECQDPEYMKLFVPGMDLHSEVAFRVWPNLAKHGPDCHRGAKPGCDCGVVAKCHCELRDQAKVFGHGFSYGLGANGMAMQHGVDVAVAESFIIGMTQAFPRLAEWKEETRQAAGVLKYGESAPANDSYRILHTWAGRPLRVERNRAYTQATAQVGQGGTRDVMARVIRNLPAEYRRRVRAVIHDEFILSLPKHRAQEVAQEIADGMAFDLRGVRITFGCSRVSPNWAGCYGEQYETAA